MYNQPNSISGIKASACINPTDSPESAQRLDRIEAEFRQAFNFLEKLPKNVSIFGSSMVQPDNRQYAKARELATRLVSEQRLAVVTGGGPGVMEAANRGAAEAGGISAALRIDLSTGEGHNNYANRSLDFHYFFARKVALTFAASMYVFFPGGYGTMDEFFELITLIQTNKIQHIPIVCVGASYWEPLERFMDYYMLRSDAYISPSDLGLFTITDNLDVVMDIAQRLPERT